MGKKSKYPSYSGGTIKVNGETVATTKKKGKNIVSSYNMSDTEKSVYDSIQNGLSTSLANLFNFSDNQMDLWNQELDSYKNQGMKSIESIYSPMETQLKNDVAARFGNLDNSVFLDKLNSITDKKAEAVASLSDSLLQKQDELYSTEMKNRINYITFLNNLNTIMNENILSYTSAAMNNSNSGNSYNSNAYKSSSSDYLSDIASLALKTMSYI